VALLINARIPAQGYGGTERVVTWLARGLTELGHQVTVLAPPGSTSSHAKIIPFDLPREHPRNFDYRSLLPPGTDVVHAHFPLHAQPDSPRFWWTLHGNARAGEVLPPNGIALSQDHATRHELSRYVYNGLDPDDYRFSPTKQDFDLFIGRLHTVKGWQWAIDGARKGNLKLVLAGGWRPSIRPSISYLRSIDGEKKQQLLSDAACLWAPAQWDEPFGLTTIEAMVSGTPVLGTRRGALPEIITPASGAMGDSVEELLEARPRLLQLDPEMIRENVMTRFTNRIMAGRYVEIYES
jgi:glycosyltransferase involved in cell wall biosynthesis